MVVLVLEHLQPSGLPLVCQVLAWAFQGNAIVHLLEKTPPGPRPTLGLGLPDLAALVLLVPPPPLLACLTSVPRNHPLARGVGSSCAPGRWAAQLAQLAPTIWLVRPLQLCLAQAIWVETLFGAHEALHSGLAPLMGRGKAQTWLCSE